MGDQSRSRQRMEGEDYMVYGFTSISKIGSNRPGTDGVRVENFPGPTTPEIPAETQRMMTEIKCEPEHFQRVLIFMSMYNDIEWCNKATEKIVLRIFVMSRIMFENSRKGIGRFLALDQKRNNTQLTYTNTMENGTKKVIL